MPGDDLGELLGRFLQQMVDQNGPPPARRPAAPARPLPPRTAPPPVLVAQPARPLPGPLVAAEAVEVEPVTGDDVAEYVARHLDSRRVTEHAAHLGEDVSRAQAQIQEHQRQLFGAGPQGQLAARAAAGDGSTSSVAPKVTKAEPSDMAKNIASSLRSPESVRTAFILGEILQRPQW
ncbi:MAG: hypothetical protein U0939_09810 [Pirellulales bacterium]